MKNYLFFTLLFSLFFACKKDNTNTPEVLGKKLEISGLVIDFETGKPLQGLDIYLIKIKGNSIFPFSQKKTVSDKDGKYSFKFIQYYPLAYAVWAGKNDDYISFDGANTCRNGSKEITPAARNINGRLVVSKNVVTNHTFTLNKAAKINVFIDLKKIPVSDSIFFQRFQKFKNKEIPSYTLKFSAGINIHIPEILTLADRMTYLTWKLKSESVWHQDSIMTPFGKIVDYEIKY